MLSASMPLIRLEIQYPLVCLCTVRSSGCIDRFIGIDLDVCFWERQGSPSKLRRQKTVSSTLDVCKIQPTPSTSKKSCPRHLKKAKIHSTPPKKKPKYIGRHKTLFPPVSGILLMTYSAHSTVYFLNLLLNFSSFSSLCFCKFAQDKFVNQMLWRHSILPILIPKNIILMLALQNMF